MKLNECASAHAPALPCPTPDQRQEWVRRGFRDPRAAYRSHAAGAAYRGIEFKLTFAEWWSYWEPHYHERGVHKGQKCMCRTGDKGAYEVGNVRIDTGKANAAEHGHVYRAALLASGRLPAEERKGNHGSGVDWMWRRSVFQPYEEDEYGEPVWG